MKVCKDRALGLRRIVNPVPIVPPPKNSGADEFQQKYNKLVLGLQHDVSAMGPNPIVSLSAWAVEKRLVEESMAAAGGGL